MERSVQTAPAPPLRIVDALLVTGFALALFAYCGISGRPLTMHEARLPQTSREMLINHDWLLPHSGIRPWLERPPLPHWIVVASIKLFAPGPAILPVWVVRLPSAVMGTLTALLATILAGRWFGRGAGVMSGLLLATSFEFYRYAGSAEDDIYLAAIVAAAMAMFALAEFSPRYAADRRAHFAIGRTWPVLAFFLLLGLTNWAKGPLLGMAVIGSSVGCYLLWSALADGTWRQAGRYVWLWGWLVAAALAAAWPLWAYHRYPDVLDNWKYDYLGRVSGAYSDINEPWYYYAATILWAMAPWAPACLIGLAAAVGRSRRGSNSPSASVTAPRANPYRFICCWAIAPLVLFSIPHGKHHHYLIPFLAPWAMLAGIGLVEAGRFLLPRRAAAAGAFPWIAVMVIGMPPAVAIAWLHQRIPGPAAVDVAWIIGYPLAVGLLLLGMARRSGSFAIGVLLAVIFAGYCWAETYVAPATDHTVADTQFLLRVRSEVPATVPLYINARLGPTGNLDFFRIQFYSRPTAMLLHNLTYLRDQTIHAPVVYVITRSTDAPRLATLGSAIVIDQSTQSHEQNLPLFGPFTLFKLTFDPNLPRYPASTPITTMQAMERGPAGPWCGPPM